MRLTPDEVERYRRDGLVVPRYRIPSRRLAALRRAVDEVLRSNPAVPADRLINPHLLRSAPEGARGAREFFELACDSALLDLVESVLGPDIILWSSHLFCKPSGAGREVPWHQDGHYWPIRPLATCSVWVALDDVTSDNGAMAWVPGSHSARALYRHDTVTRPDLALNRVLAPGQVDLGAARRNELEAGQLSLHDVYLVHGSAPNRSPNRRAGLVLRYMPATSVFDRGIRDPEIVVDFSRMPIRLVRGRDRTGENDFETGAAALAW